MSIRYVYLKDVINKPISGEWGDSEGDTKVIRTTNFTNDGVLDLKVLVERNIDSKKISQKRLEFGDTIIEKSGGSPNQPVGRVVYFDQKEDIFLCNNFTSLIRAKNDVDKRYLFWFLFNNHSTKKTLKYQNKTTGIINLQLERYIEELQIPLPPLTIQKRIAEILDTADALRRKDEALLKKYDELAQAIFIDMFEKNKNTVKLNEITTKITDGVHAKPNYQETGIPFLSVKNATKKFLDFSDIKYISEIDHKEYTKRCKPEFDDILYTKVGATYGRAAIVDTEKEFSIYVSLALIKPNKSLIYPFYLNFVLNSDFVKRQADRRIKGAGVPDLHLVEIKDFDIPLPSFDKQLEFSNIIENLNKNTLNVKVQIEKSTNLFNSLLQKAFNGELIV